MRTTVAVWLILSILLEISTSAILYLWLRRRIEVSAARYGFPGYLERRFLAWCRQESVDGRIIVGVRIALMFNLLAAALVGIPIVFNP